MSKESVLGRDPRGRAQASVRTFVPMKTTAPSLLVFEVEKANYASFTWNLHDALGRSLDACSQVQAVWVAAEDAGTRRERHYLQFALTIGSRDADDLVGEILLHLEREHRVKLAFAPRTPKSDVVPHEIVDELELSCWTNPYVTLHRRFGG